MLGPCVTCLVQALVHLEASVACNTPCRRWIDLLSWDYWPSAQRGFSLVSGKQLGVTSLGNTLSPQSCESCFMKIMLAVCLTVLPLQALPAHINVICKLRFLPVSVTFCNFSKPLLDVPGCKRCCASLAYSRHHWLCGSSAVPGNRVWIARPWDFQGATNKRTGPFMILHLAARIPPSSVPIVSRDGWKVSIQFEGCRQVPVKIAACHTAASKIGCWWHCPIPVGMSLCV